MNRVEIQILADVRIEESRALLTLPVPMPDGAYYLVGYAVELALKSCIARTYSEHDWPEKKFVADCHTHNIMALVKLADLDTQRAVAAAADVVLGRNWQIVKDWSELSRYERHSLVKAQKMYEAVNDNVYGVLTWIKGRW